MLKTGGASPHSRRIAELDKKRDDVYTGMAAHTRNMKKHLDAEKAETAYQAEVITRKTGTSDSISTKRVYDSWSGNSLAGCCFT